MSDIRRAPRAPATHVLGRWFAGMALCLPLATAIAATATTPPVTVNLGAARQEIDGFGASSAWYAEDLMRTPEPARTQIVDLLFAQSGAGLSILRNRVPFELSASAGTYNWSADQGARWLMGEAKERGTSRFMSTPWTPPKYMKTNGSEFNGGSLKTTSYQAYADYLSRYLREYKNTYGLNIYAISIQNEPELVTEYESCIWTPAQFKTFIRDYLTPTFARDGVTTKVMAAESNLWYEGMVQDTLKDANARNGLHIVGAHPYFAGNRTGNSGYDVFPYTKKYGKQLWATEVSKGTSDDITDGLFWAKLIHKQMTVPESNAFLFWWGASLKEASAGEDLITFNATSGQYQVHRRLWAMANFSRFIRPGYRRVDTTADPTATVHVSAYKSATSDKLVMVAINDGTAPVAVPMNLYKFTTASVMPYRTSATESMAQQAAIGVSNGSFQATLPAKSITTFTATGTAGGGVNDVADFVNEMTDLRGTVASSGDLTTAFIVNTGEADAYDGDDTRMTRMTNTTQWLDYPTPANFKQFDLTVFHNDSVDASPVKLMAGNGTTVTALPVSMGVPKALGGSWYKVVYTLQAGGLPSGTKFIRVQIPQNSKDYWTPQLGKVRVDYYR